MPEYELIKKLQAGDHVAFKQMFENYNAMVFNVCVRMVDNRQEAEDVTQDVFFKAYKSLKRFRSESKVSTWLYRIAINLCLNYQRKQKRARWFSLDFFPESLEEEIRNLPISEDNRPDVLLEKSERKRIVKQAINSLSNKQRVAVILHRYEELSYKEIAEVMGCSVASVESRLHQAKVNLTKKLLPMLNEI